MRLASMLVSAARTSRSTARATMRLSAAILSVGLVLSSCKTVEEPQETDVKYLDTGWNLNSCSIAHSTQPELKVCVRGGTLTAAADQKIRKSLLKWLAPLRQKYENVTTKIAMSCDNPHVNVQLTNGFIQCMASPGSITCGDQNELGTWIHEFGHAFACLGDTYVGGRAAYCMANQPKSIMCWGLLLDELMQDDIEGLHYQFNRLTLNKVLVDPTGDEDGDGITNGKDKCPGSLAGAAVWRDQEEGKWMGCALGQTPIF